MVYVDRTAYIREVERLGSTLVFLRPRRFGKSLWLQTLANYYDLRRAGEHAELFGSLAIGHEPTPYQRGEELSLRSYVIVAVDLERILGEEIGFEPNRGRRFAGAVS